MTDLLEGNGYLFQEDRLMAPVRYRIRWSTDGWGRTVVEGEVWPRWGVRKLGQGRRFMMHTESGFSVPLEVTAYRSKGWMPFRRLQREEAVHEVG